MKGDAAVTDACAPEIRSLVERQARAWESGDVAALLADWHDRGVLTAPGVVVSYPELERAFREFHAGYHELAVTIRTVFHSADRRRVAIEWDWTVTRRADGARGTTPDAILADLEDGLIVSWREYFDTAGAVEHAERR